QALRLRASRSSGHRHRAGAVAPPQLGARGASVMGLAGAALVGFLSGRLIWVLVRPGFTTAITVRENWRGREVVKAAGMVAPVAGESIGRLLADGALVALAANLGNLLDRRPGRVIKVASVAFVALAIATGAAHALGGVAVVIGAALALVLDDLHERLMLGDARANVLGAVDR